MSFRLSSGLLAAMMGSTGFNGALGGGVIHLFSGIIPTDADQSEGAGTMLLAITVDGNELTSGGGLMFDTPTDGTISKVSSANWKGTGVANGTASWFRFYDSNVTTGASTTAIRLDGTVSISNADLIMTNTSIVTGAVSSIDTAYFTLPSTL